MLSLEAEMERSTMFLVSPEKLFAGSNIEKKGKSGWHPVSETKIQLVQ
jgi:hypothetical protein